MVMQQLREFFHGKENRDSPTEPEQEAAESATNSAPSETETDTSQSATIPPDFTPPSQPADGVQAPPASSAPPPATATSADALTIEKLKQMSASQINDNWGEVSALLEKGYE